MKNNNQQKSPGCLYILFCVFVWMPFLLILVAFSFMLLVQICSKLHPAVLVLILIAVVAAAGYVLYKKHEKKKQAEENHTETVLQRTVAYSDPIKRESYQEKHEKKKQAEENHAETVLQRTVTYPEPVIREPRQAPKPPDGLYEQDHLAKLAADQDARRAADAHYGTVFLDIETTSYNDNSAKYDNDILQVSIIDENEDVLIDQYCKPRKKESWENASKINSIYFSAVSDCPRFLDVKPYVQDIFERADKIVVFDYNFVKDYLEKYKFDLHKFRLTTPVYELRQYNVAHGIENPKWMTLENAADQFDLIYDRNNSLEDAKAILKIYNFIEEQNNAVKKERSENKIDNSVKQKYKQNVNADKNGYFYGKKIAFIDDVSIPKEKAFEEVSNRGAIIRLTVSPTLDILVCGSRSVMMSYKYGEKSNEQKKAEQLNENGAHIEIMSAQKFIELLNQPARDD
nr:MAG TPA: DEDDh [Caudoviricetes sp.]